MEGISETIGTILSNNLFPIDLIILITSPVILIIILIHPIPKSTIIEIHVVSEIIRIRRPLCDLHSSPPLSELLQFFLPTHHLFLLLFLHNGNRHLFTLSELLQLQALLLLKVSIFLEFLDSSMNVCTLVD